MRDIICKNHRLKIYSYAFVVALSFIFSLFFYSNCSAYDGWTNNPTAYYIRAYNANGIVQNSDYGYQTPPFNLLLAGQSRTFYGFRISEFDVSGGNYKTLTTLYVDVTLRGQTYWWQDFGTFGTTAFSVESNTGTYYNGECTYSGSENNTIAYRCKITLPSGEKPNKFNLRIGNVNNITGNTIPLALVTTSNFVLNYLGWGYDTASSEEAGLLQQQIEQQQQQIDQDNQDRNNIENSSQQAEQQGESAGDNASNTGTTLFSAFTTLVGALTNVHQTNCNLAIPDINFQNGGSFNLGTLNLCTLDVPTGLSALGSLLLVFLIVPMGINCAKRMLSLYNELLGGK